MKLSEKNVLIGTAVVFILAIGLLKFGPDRAIDQIENNFIVEIASSSYDVNEGNLVLQFDNPADEFDVFHVTIVDQHNNLSSGTSQLVEDKLIFHTIMPDLHFQAPLEVKIEDMTTQQEVTVVYKIPEAHIAA